jgi:hypothetical protein
MSAAEQIVALVEQELALVREHRFDEVEALQERGRAALAALPVSSSAPTRAALQRAWELRTQVTHELEAARRSIAAELLRLDGARDGVRAYAAAGALA